MLRDTRDLSLNEVVAHINCLLHLLHKERGSEAMMRALRDILRSVYIHPDIVRENYHLPWYTLIRGTYDCPRMREEAEKIIRSHM